MSFENADFSGKMNITMFMTKHGRSIMIQHDVSLPRPLSRIHLVSGTEAIARKWPSERIGNGHSWLSDQEFKDVAEKYTPESVKKVNDLAKRLES